MLVRSVSLALPLGRPGRQNSSSTAILQLVSTFGRNGATRESFPRNQWAIEDASCFVDSF
jgi:hypothetical protein